jgi:hypothetical protein
MRYPDKAVEKSLTVVFISRPLKLAIVYFWFNGFGGRPKALAGLGATGLMPPLFRRCLETLKLSSLLKSGGEPRGLGFSSGITERNYA